MRNPESNIPNPDAGLALVDTGWEHLKAQRPLAAWATWRRASRHDEGQPAADQALATLASSGDLPAVARSVHRLREPEDPGRRSAWDERLRTPDGDGAHLEAMADAFGRLAAEGPSDS